jgi:GNAT superfamily N-acetyltransferase
MASPKQLLALGPDLRPPVTDAEWSIYHEIRRRVLFELRGNGDAYDPRHPDELRPGNHPFVLWTGGEAVGVIRVDIDADAAIFRRVAVREDVQRRGHGRQMLAAAADFARNQGCRRLVSHVDRAAVGFYQRCGFSIVKDPSPKDSTVLMIKALDVALDRGFQPLPG